MVEASSGVHFISSIIIQLISGSRTDFPPTLDIHNWPVDLRSEPIPRSERKETKEAGQENEAHAKCRSIISLPHPPTPRYFEFSSFYFYLDVVHVLRFDISSSIVVCSK